MADLPKLDEQKIINKTILDLEAILKFYGKSLMTTSELDKKMYFDIYQKGMIAAIEHATNNKI